MLGGSGGIPAVLYAAARASYRWPRPTGTASLSWGTPIGGAGPRSAYSQVVLRPGALAHQPLLIHPADGADAAPPSCSTARRRPNRGQLRLHQTYYFRAGSKRTVNQTVRNLTGPRGTIPGSGTSGVGNDLRLWRVGTWPDTAPRTCHWLTIPEGSLRTGAMTWRSCYGTRSVGNDWMSAVTAWDPTAWDPFEMLWLPHDARLSDWDVLQGDERQIRVMRQTEHDHNRWPEEAVRFGRAAWALRPLRQRRQVLGDLRVPSGNGRTKNKSNARPSAPNWSWTSSGRR